MSGYEHGKLVGKSIGYGAGYQEGYKTGRSDVIAELESLGISVPDCVKSVSNGLNRANKGVVVTSYDGEEDSGYEAN